MESTTNTKRQPFFGDASRQAFYIDRMRQHMDADELIRGTGWENGRGCAIGCMFNGYDHSQFEREINAPEQVARLVDALFENLPGDKYYGFPLRFLESINLQSNTNLWLPKFYVWLLVDPDHGVIQYAGESAKPSIQRVAELYQLEINGEEIDPSARGDDWADVNAAAAAAAWASVRASTAAAAAARDTARDAARDAARAAQANALIHIVGESA